jgi:hypothetical protein
MKDSQTRLPPSLTECVVKLIASHRINLFTVS